MRREQVLVTRDLSAGGCFIRTTTPLPKDSLIRVRIAHAGADFKAVGRVTDNVSEDGMGVEFVEIGADDRAVLQKWVAGETPVNDTATMLLIGGLLLLIGGAIVAAVALMRL